MNRVGTYSRKTNETQIDITFNIDGKGKANIDTGIGFLTICLIILQDMVYLI